jgi:hypothetical protein
MKSELLKEYRSACLDFFEKEIENLMGFEYSGRVNRENDGWNSIEFFYKFNRRYLGESTLSRLLLASMSYKNDFRHVCK